MGVREPLTIIGEIERVLFKPDSSTVSLFDAVKNLADCRAEMAPQSIQELRSLATLAKKG